jgi:hypothetical protein
MLSLASELIYAISWLAINGRKGFKQNNQLNDEVPLIFTLASLFVQYLQLLFGPWWSQRPCCSLRLSPCPFVEAIGKDKATNPWWCTHSCLGLHFTLFYFFHAMDTIFLRVSRLLSYTISWFRPPWSSLACPYTAISGTTRDQCHEVQIFSCLDACHVRDWSFLLQVF